MLGLNWVLSWLDLGKHQKIHVRSIKALYPQIRLYIFSISIYSRVRYYDRFLITEQAYKMHTNPIIVYKCMLSVRTILIWNDDLYINFNLKPMWYSENIEKYNILVAFIENDIASVLMIRLLILILNTFIAVILYETLPSAAQIIICNLRVSYRFY